MGPKLPVIPMQMNSALTLWQPAIECPRTLDYGRSQVCKYHFGSYFRDRTIPAFTWPDNCEEEQAGMIAAMGTVLTGANINIGDFRLGHREDAGNAVAIIQVDTPPFRDVLDQLAALPVMLMVR
jgi:hypothetical protein